jgi:aryl-alcohol dehydrogenase-like predicted oxidoreductase
VDGERISRLALGTAQFGLDYGISNVRGRVLESEARTILATAAAAGVGLVDTAASYGLAEATLGRNLDAAPGVRVVTKTIPLASGLAAVEARARRSLKLMTRESVYALLVHRPADLRENDGPALWRRLRSLQDAGLYEKIGISAYADDRPLELAEKFRPDVMQLPVSLLDQRLVADGTLSRLMDQGVEIHVRSVFHQGLIFLDPETLPPTLAHGAEKLEIVRDEIRKSGLAPLEAALDFVFSLPEPTCAVIGVTRHEELRQILRALCRPLAAMRWNRFAMTDTVLLTPSLWS